MRKTSHQNRGLLRFDVVRRITSLVAKVTVDYDLIGNIIIDYDYMPFLVSSINYDYPKKL